MQPLDEIAFAILKILAAKSNEQLKDMNLYTDEEVASASYNLAQAFMIEGEMREAKRELAIKEMVEKSYDRTK